MSETIYQLSSDYQLSTDYSLLAKLAREHSIICVVNYKNDLRDVASTIWQPAGHGYSELFQVSVVRGYCYLHAFGEQDCWKQCASANLGFLKP